MNNKNAITIVIRTADLKKTRRVEACMNTFTKITAVKILPTGNVNYTVEGEFLGIDQFGNDVRLKTTKGIRNIRLDEIIKVEQNEEISVENGCDTTSLPEKSESDYPEPAHEAEAKSFNLGTIVPCNTRKVLRDNKIEIELEKTDRWAPLYSKYIDQATGVVISCGTFSGENLDVELDKTKKKVTITPPSSWSAYKLKDELKMVLSINMVMENEDTISMIGNVFVAAIPTNTNYMPRDTFYGTGNTITATLTNVDNITKIFDDCTGVYAYVVNADNPSQYQKATYSFGTITFDTNNWDKLQICLVGITTEAIYVRIPVTILPEPELSDEDTPMRSTETWMGSMNVYANTIADLKDTLENGIDLTGLSRFTENLLKKLADVLDVVITIRQGTVDITLTEYMLTSAGILTIADPAILNIEDPITGCILIGEASFCFMLNIN